MGGLILRGRPALFGGALADPKHRMFAQTRRTARVLQSAASALCLSLSALPGSMASISSICDCASLGAMLLGITCRGLILWQHHGTVYTNLHTEVH